MSERGRGFLLGAALFLGLNLGAIVDLGCERTWVGRWRPYPAPAPPPPVREADVEVLAVVAKAEDPQAAEAVMWVVLNRAREAGRTVLAVASARRQFHGWSAEPAARRWPGAADRREVARLRLVARAVLSGRVADPTGGARYFHRQGTAAPAWAPAPRLWRALGRHYFYTGPEALEKLRG